MLILPCLCLFKISTGHVTGSIKREDRQPVGKKSREPIYTLKNSKRRADKWDTSTPKLQRDLSPCWHVHYSKQQEQQGQSILPCVGRWTRSWEKWAFKFLLHQHQVWSRARSTWQANPVGPCLHPKKAGWFPCSSACHWAPRATAGCPGHRGQSYTEQKIAPERVPR